MEYYFGSVIERDADLAIMNAFERSELVRSLFLDKINRKGAVLIKSYHSLVQAEKGYGVGESDIVFVLKDNNGSFGILIEDKINANAQGFQKERYDVRGAQMVEDKMFEKFYVFLCAPKSYFKGSKADKYKDMTVSYESISSMLESGLDKAILDKASESESGIVVDKRNTDFWNKLYDHVKDNYKNLDLSGKKGDKPARSLWPAFRTKVKNLVVVMKISSRSVDLEFSGMGGRIKEVDELLNKVGINKKSEQTNKSASVRYPIEMEDALYTTIDFNEQIDKVNKWLDIVSFLTERANALKDLGIDETPLS